MINNIIIKIYGEKGRRESSRKVPSGQKESVGEERRHDGAVKGGKTRKAAAADR